MWSQLLPWLLLAGCVIAVNSAAAVLIFRLSARIRGLTSELELAGTERAQLEHGRITLEADLASRTRELEDLERRSREVPEPGAERERIDELERRLEAQSALAARVPGLETHLAARERELGERTAELEAATHARHELEQGAERRTSELAELERKARELEAELRGRQDETAETRRRLDEHRDELERARRASADRERELESRLHEREAAHSARAAELEGELAGREDDLARRAETAELLQVELDEARRRIDALRDELEAERRARTERERELERRVEEREATLSGRAAELEEELRRRSETLEVLQEELAEGRRRLDDLSGRREELEGNERSSAERERALGQRLHEVQDTLGGRMGELEAALAEREAELRRRSEALESLREEAAEARSRLAALSGQRDELAQQGLAQSERERALRARVEEIESVVSARIDELEEGLADRDDALAQSSATIAELQAEIARGAAALENARRRADELALQGQRRLHEEQERATLAQERERRAAQLAAELERRLAANDQELARLRAECVELASRCGGLSERVDARERELRDRDRSLSGAQARLTELASEVQRRRARFEADQLEIERLVEGRILSVFGLADAKGAEPLPEAYLAGLAAGDLELAVRGLLGGEEPLSADALTSLCERWRDGYAAWTGAPIERHVEYLWADGLRVRAGVAPGSAEERSLLVAVACYADGETAPIALESGDAASKEAWLALLRHLERRGMNAPRLVVTGETTGAPAALDELGWTSAVQLCWNGRTAAVLAALPGSRHGAASKALRALSLAKTRAKAKQLRERFVKRCGKRHAAAGERAGTQWRRMTSLHAFPPAHHPHLRTTELVGAPFARLRLLADVSQPAPKPFDGTPEIEPILWRLASLAHGVFPKVTPEPVPSAARPRALRALARAA